jgi:hypothetical protein
MAALGNGITLQKNPSSEGMASETIANLCTEFTKLSGNREQYEVKAPLSNKVAIF